jgi:signal transduction histidine kinase
MLPVDTTPAPTAIKLVKVGYQVEVTGVCIMEGENWSPYSAFPQIHGVLLVVRTPDDIHVIDRPSWWTAGRLLAALAILLIILGGILFWNIQLRKAVRKREIELKHEIFNHVNSDMKIRERNNLSIELHDSLSQGLTGVSMEIDTARRLTDDPAGITRHLKLAARSLKSCLDELKACIHDLRTNTLGDCDMDESIRRTLVPFISDTELSIRFNVPRNLISDNIAHNVLRIIRELVVNAVRHGQASSVKIAGSIAGQTLCFSVQDNGCGFDPTTCPGPDQGHFGLQGIRERLKRLNGSLTIGGKGINGTRAAVMIELQTERSEQQ